MQHLKVVGKTEEQNFNYLINFLYGSLRGSQAFMNKFIVFEGIDGCGKTTLSKLVAEKLGWEWTREPTFSSAKADRLNNKKSSNNREVEFAIDRIMHIASLEASRKNFICDRYIWTGFVYCLKYNVGSYNFIKEFYRHKFFPKPQITIFVDTPVKVCFERAQARTGKSPQSIETLEELRRIYLDTLYINENFSTVIKVSSENDIQKLAKSLVRKIRNLV